MFQLSSSVKPIWQNKVFKFYHNYLLSCFWVRMTFKYGKFHKDAFKLRNKMGEQTDTSKKMKGSLVLLANQQAKKMGF